MSLTLIGSLVLYSCKNEKTIKEYYENGKLKNLISLWDGDSTVTEYYMNGKIKFESKYRNGKLDGIRKEYYDDGMLKALGNHKTGLKNGYYNSYYSNGKLQQIGFYLFDTISGEIKAFDEKGKWYQRQYYINFHGTVKDVGTVGYDSLGNINYESRRVEILPSVDTIDKGRNLIINLELKKPRFDSTYFVVGEFDRRFDLKDSVSLDTIFANFHRAEINKIFTKSGMTFLRGYAVNGEIISENKNKDTYKYSYVPFVYFEKRFYVR